MVCMLCRHCRCIAMLRVRGWMCLWAERKTCEAREWDAETTMWSTKLQPARFAWRSSLSNALQHCIFCTAQIAGHYMHHQTPWRIDSLSSTLSRDTCNCCSSCFDRFIGLATSLIRTFGCGIRLQQCGCNQFVDDIGQLLVPQDFKFIENVHYPNK